MRVSIWREASPRQYAPATDCRRNAPTSFVDGPCGPRHRSVNGPFVYRETVSTPWSRTRSSISSTL